MLQYVKRETPPRVDTGRCDGIAGSILRFTPTRTPSLGEQGRAANPRQTHDVRCKEPVFMVVYRASTPRYARITHDDNLPLPRLLGKKNAIYEKTGAG